MSWKIQELKLALNNSLKKLIFNGNLHHVLQRMANVKSISNHYRRFKLTISLSQAAIVADMLHTLLPPSINHFS